MRERDKAGGEVRVWVVWVRCRASSLCNGNVIVVERGSGGVGSEVSWRRGRGRKGGKRFVGRRGDEGERGWSESEVRKTERGI